MNCKICRKESKEMECPHCAALLKHGADERTIIKMCADTETNKIWKENEERANTLAQAYYESVIENYAQNSVKKSSKEEFGFNTFADGIRVGLDIILPLVDKETQEKIKKKISTMQEVRKMQTEKEKR